MSEIPEEQENKMLQNFAANPHAHVVQYLIDSGQVSTSPFCRWPEDGGLVGACAHELAGLFASQGIKTELFPFGEGAFPQLGLPDGYLGVVVGQGRGALPILEWEPWAFALSAGEAEANMALFSDVLVLDVRRSGDEMNLLGVASGKLWDFAGCGRAGELVVSGGLVMSGDFGPSPGKFLEFRNEYELLQAAKIVFAQERGFDAAEEWYRLASMYAAPYMRF